MRLPDPARSYAVLIGTSSYRSPDLANLPAVRNNLDGLVDVLTNPSLSGLPAERCVVLPDPTDVRATYRTLRKYADLAEDTLLVYFAGHGCTDPRNELYLGLADTDPDELRVSALSFDLVREVFGDSRAVNRVLILDCCFSGRAIADMSGPHEAILGQLGIEGSYTLTSAPANSVAIAPPGAAYTAFTGELLSLARTGVPGGPEFLTFATIYRQVLHTLVSRGFPRPGQRGTGTIDQLAFARNPAHVANRCLTPTVNSGPPLTTWQSTEERGFDFIRSIRRMPGEIFGVVVGISWGTLFTYWFFNLLPGQLKAHYGWLTLATLGLLALAGLWGAAGGIFTLLRRQRVSIDRAGITTRFPGRRPVKFPWKELDSVEIRHEYKALLLVCKPKADSILLADKRTKRMWREGAGDFAIIDVNKLACSPHAVRAALVRYSGHRYQG